MKARRIRIVGLGVAMLALLVLGIGACDDEDTEPQPTPTGTPSGTGATGGGGTGGGGTGGGGTGGGTGVCTPDDTQDCYEGPAGTEDVGICHGGTQTCTPQGIWGACTAQQLPETEDCTVADDEDCDGVPCSEHIFSGLWGNSASLNQDGLDVAADAAGNWVITGSYEGAAFNLGGSDLPTFGNNEIYVALYDAAGTHQWSRGIGGTGQDRGLAVAFDSSGDVIVAGSCEGGTDAVDFGGSVGTISCRQTDTFLAKLDGTDGSSIWARHFGGAIGESSGTRVPWDVALDSNNNIYVTGIQQGLWLCGNYSDWGTWVVKLSPDGVSQQWLECWNSTGSEVVRTVRVDANDDIVIGGYFFDTITFGSTPHSTHDPGVVRYAFVARLSGTDGTATHSLSLGDGSTSDNQIVSGLGIDASNNVIITGYFDHAVDLAGTGVAGTGTSVDGFVARLGPTLTYDWHLLIDDSSGDSGQRPNALVVDSQGNVAVGGALRGTVDFGTGDVTADGTDLFLLKVSGSDGSHLWHKVMGSPGGGITEEVVWAVATDTNDRVGITGVAWGPIDFGSGTALSHHGGKDVFLAVYHP